MDLPKAFVGIPGPAEAEQAAHKGRWRRSGPALGRFSARLPDQNAYFSACGRSFARKRLETAPE